MGEFTPILKPKTRTVVKPLTSGSLSLMISKTICISACSTFAFLPSLFFSSSTYANSVKESNVEPTIPTGTVSERERCLLKAIAQASAETTVKQLQHKCSPVVIELANTPQESKTLFERRLGSELTAWGQPFTLMLHRPNYLLPITSQQRVNDTTFSKPNKSSEALFQVSFKFPLSPPLFDGRVAPFFAYTGKSWWQVYDSDRSRPFREYNHEPEIFLAAPGFKGEIFGWKHQLTTVGFNHQSNGRSVPESRSWNRLTAEVFFDKSASNWASLKLWYRIPEREKKSSTDQGGDDNPDISRYLGYAELRLGDVTANNHFTLTLRRSLDSKGKGSGQFDWSRPTGFTPTMRWYAQYFDGYGESLIDYNQRIRRFGLGVMINDWF
jgi:phospholipase A1/A2